MDQVVNAISKLMEPLSLDARYQGESAVRFSFENVGNNLRISRVLKPLPNGFQFLELLLLGGAIAFDVKY